jgi:hypothetical protein
MACPSDASYRKAHCSGLLMADLVEAIRYGLVLYNDGGCVVGIHSHFELSLVVASD